MDEYVIYREFGRMKLTTKANYNTVWQNASKIIDVNNFKDEESVRDYLIREWKLLESQITIIR